MISTSIARIRRPASAADAPHGFRRLAPPRALAALLVLTALVGVGWAFVTPAFQAPDEPAHFGYVQELAEGFDLPGSRAGRSCPPSRRSRGASRTPTRRPRTSA